MDTLQTILTLIGTLVGLLSTGIPLIISLVKLFKNKKANEVWTTIVTMADAAIKEAEASGKTGTEKKQMVIDSVKAGCAAVGIDIGDFGEQLSAYIDSCIKFVNDMTKK